MRTRAAQIVGDIRPYRVAFIDRLAARDDLELVVLAGDPAPGMGSPTEAPSVAVPTRRLVNRFWPHARSRIMWQGGALQALRGDFDVIVCAEITSNLTIWAVRLLHRAFGKKLVLVGYFFRPEKRRFTGVRSLVRRALRGSASTFISYTERGQRELLRAGISQDRIFVRYNTVDTAHLEDLAEQVSDDDRAELRSRLDIRPDADVLIFLGRLRHLKRVEVAIEAVRILAARSDKPPVLLVVGDGPERTALESVAAGAPVRFVGVTYDEEDVAGYFAISTFLVMPGTVGLTCAHGFANGVPCMTTSDAAVAQTPEFEYVKNQVNGLILDRAEPLVYADAIEQALADTALLDRLRRGAAESSRELRMDRMVDAFAQALHTAVGEGAAVSSSPA